jgi:hypothetical protein
MAPAVHHSVEEERALIAHAERYLGPVRDVMHQIVSSYVHVDILLAEPTPSRPMRTLVTCGMSSRPMNAPAELEHLRFAELMLMLPPNWPLDRASLQHRSNFWPIEWLQRLAVFPHQYETWLGIDHTVPNGDPPQSLAPGTSFAGFILAPPLTEPAGFERCQFSAKKRVVFLTLVPFYREEIWLKLESGADELSTRLVAAGVTGLVQPGRRNVAVG